MNYGPRELTGKDEVTKSRWNLSRTESYSARISDFRLGLLSAFLFTLSCVSELRKCSFFSSILMSLNL